MTEVKNTAEDILLEKVGKLSLSGLKWKSLNDRKHLIVEAMHEYSQQVSAKLLEALEKIAKWELPETSEFRNMDRNGVEDYFKQLVEAAIKRARGL
jgi:hypothetical protein